MLHLTEQTRIMLAIQPVDFRKQIDGLIAICQHKLQQKTDTGLLFVFINKPRTMIRILSYQVNGYWLATKRLSKGKYISWPKSNANLQTLAAAELTNVLQGLLAS